jgi:hypothetical protein
MVLKQVIRDSRHATTDTQHRDKVRRRHELEQQIVELESRPKKQGRSALLQRLRKELQQLRDA